VVYNISDRHPCGNHTKTRVEGSQLAQKRLKSRFAQPTFLWARWILERLQAIQNQQGSAMRDELRQSLALLPPRSEPWIWISKPSESRIKKFICGRRTTACPLSVEGPAKNELSRTVMVSSHPSEPMINESGLPDPGYF
jgi:hypothetical protein